MFLSRFHTSATKALRNGEFRKMFSNKINTKILNYDEYVDIWQSIASSGLPRIATSNMDVNRTLLIDPLWLGLQQQLNVKFKSAFLAHWNRHQNALHAAIDDDKHHLSIKKGTDNLKMCRHVRDNIPGLACHTLALAACGYVLAIEYEKPTDSTCDVVKSLMTQTFSVIGCILSIPFVALHMDKGY